MIPARNMADRKVTLNSRETRLRQARRTDSALFVWITSNFDEPQYKFNVTVRTRTGNNCFRTANVQASAQAPGKYSRFRSFPKAATICLMNANPRAHDGVDQGHA